MSGIEPFLASLFATAGTTTAAATGAEAALLTGAGATAAGASAGEAALLASAAAASGLPASAAAGAAAGGTAGLLTAGNVGAASSAVGTGAQLLTPRPDLPSAPGALRRDDAQAEADRQSELLRRRGRAAALLTPGGARGDTSTPSLGAAALLGA